ncbi:MAG: RHS repeat protein [Polyangiaceae bacterium]|nr:RHS repeat protein [Polyangiaceae bacterium]
MGTTLSNKDIATPKSGHGCVSPPVMSVAPPTPPAGPITLPFPYVARSATAEGTEAALKASEKECLVERSEMKVDMPGNKPCESVKPMGGGDVVTHAICGVAVMIDGSAGTSSGGKRVCKTMDNVRMCLVMKSQQVAQATVPLLLAGGGAFAGDKGTGSEKKEEAVRTALKEQAAKTGNKTAGPPEPDLESDPVAVAGGSVVDSAVDFTIPGDLPLIWGRTYASHRSRERTSLGKGGWTHAFEQWVTEGEEVLIYRGADGRDIYFPLIEAGKTAFHRGERLTLTAQRSGAFQVVQHARRRTLSFAPITGQKAVLRSVRDAYGHTLLLDYTGNNLSKITDSAGREVRLFGSNGRIDRIEVWTAPPTAESLSPTLTTWFDLTYHPEGELASVGNALGHTERYDYDGLHRLMKKTLKNGFSFHYKYDPDTGVCTQAGGSGGMFAVKLTYNFEERTTRSTGTHEPRLYSWDAKGCVHKVEAPQELLEERTYDEDQYIVAESNGAGEVWVTERDDEGKITKLIDPAGNETVLEAMSPQLLRRVDPNGLETRFLSDAHGGLVRIENERGAVFIERDVHGRVVQVSGGDGVIAAFRYDAHGNRTDVVDSRGGKVKYKFDSLGRVLERTDLNGPMRFDRDELGRLTRIRFPDGTERLFELDVSGNVVRDTNADGRTTTYEWTGVGQLGAVITADNERWEFDHDLDGRLVQVKNPRAERYRFEFDRLGRVEREIPFDGRVIEYGYDAAGRVSRIQFPDGTYRELSYDPLGNLTESRAHDGTLTYQCDAMGRVEEAAMSDLVGKHSISLERDALGRVVRETQGTEVIEYTYDHKGRRASRTVLGRTTKYYYDVAGTVAAVDHEGYRISLGRDALGRETRRHLYTPKADILFAYDAADRLTAERVTAGEKADVLVDRRFGYTAGGNLNAVQDALWGLCRVQHNALNRLVSCSSPASTETFSYDVGGGLSGAHRAAEVGEPLEWGVRPGNLLVRTDTARFINDERGRRVEKLEQGENGATVRTVYAWDSRGQLREVTLPNGERIVYAYDAFGRRIKKVFFSAIHSDLPKLVSLTLEKGKAALPKPQVTTYLWDGNALAAEVGPGDRKRVYAGVPGALMPLLQDHLTHVYACVQGRLGVIKELIDESGKVAWAANHGAFGDVLAVRSTLPREEVEPPFRMTGQLSDPETGLTWSLHRLFDPKTGRFLGPDPLGFAGGTDLYGFNGSPLRVMDPLGLAVCTSITRSHDDALADARQRAGLPRDSEPVDSFVKVPVEHPTGSPTDVVINNNMSAADIRSKLGALGPAEVHLHPTDPNQVVIVATHNADPTRPPHTHAGTIPISEPTGTYTVNKPAGGDHHIYYGPGSDPANPNPSAW